MSVNAPEVDPLIKKRKKNAKHQTRGPHGEFVSHSDQASSPTLTAPVSKPFNSSLPPLLVNSEAATNNSLPALVSFSVTNPVTYLKLWWKRVMSGEGIDLRFRIHPLTAIAIVAILVAGGASIGWISKSVLTRVPVVREFIPAPTPTPMPTPTPDPWKDTAYTGLLKEAGTRFYLVTNESEAITLSVPENVSLSKLVGKRILAIGKFNKLTGILLVSDATDLEVLIQSTAVPTVPPTPTGQVNPEQLWIIIRRRWKPQLPLLEKN